MARAQMRGQDVPSTWSCTPAITCWQLIVISQVKKDMLLQQVACFPMLSKYLKLLISELQRKQILHLLRINKGTSFFVCVSLFIIKLKRCYFYFEEYMLLFYMTYHISSSCTEREYTLHGTVTV